MVESFVLLRIESDFDVVDTEEIVQNIVKKAQEHEYDDGTFSVEVLLQRSSLVTD